MERGAISTCGAPWGARAVSTLGKLGIISGDQCKHVGAERGGGGGLYFSVVSLGGKGSSVAQREEELSTDFTGTDGEKAIRGPGSFASFSRGANVKARGVLVNRTH